MKRYKVEYLEDGHIYLINGVIVPSVSQLVSYALGINQYENVPQSILEAKAQYGTEVHQLIQDYEENKFKEEDISYMKIDDPNKKVALNNYIKLKKKYFIYPKTMENIVNYKDKYAGRYDIMDYDGILWDIKTSYKLNIQALEWQLGLYQYAIGNKKEIGYAIWLPKKGVPKVEQINLKSFAECEELIKRYEIDNAE